MENINIETEMINKDEQLKRLEAYQERYEKVLKEKEKESK